jgi:hypothetical protein
MEIDKGTVWSGCGTCTFAALRRLWALGEAIPSNARI